MLISLKHLTYSTLSETVALYTAEQAKFKSITSYCNRMQRDD